MATHPRTRRCRGRADHGRLRCRAAEVRGKYGDAAHRTRDHDLETWLSGFNDLEDALANAGVRHTHIQQPIDDDRYIYVQLDFENVTAATAFLDHLRAVVWASPEASPGLEGTPTARVLTGVRTPAAAVPLDLTMTDCSSHLKVPFNLPLTVVPDGDGWRGSLPWTDFTAPMRPPDSGPVEHFRFLAPYFAWMHGKEDELAKFRENVVALSNAVPPSDWLVRQDGAWIALTEPGLVEQVVKLQSSQERLEGESGTDALTGLPNRRALDGQLEHFDGMSKYFDDPSTCSVLFIDIDHFHAYNREHGDRAGDELLGRVAELLRSICRNKDTPFRKGGEEFVITLPGLDLAGAAGVAERVRKAVESAAELHGALEDVPVVTVTVGVAQQVPGEKFGQTVERAAKATYEAKNDKKRNTVRLATQRV